MRHCLDSFVILEPPIGFVASQNSKWGRGSTSTPPDVKHLPNSVYACKILEGSTGEHSVVTTCTQVGPWPYGAFNRPGSTRTSWQRRTSNFFQVIGKLHKSIVDSDQARTSRPLAPPIMTFCYILPESLVEFASDIPSPLQYDGTS